MARMPHHEGIKALWETKWKFPCTKSLYPFHDGKFEDFEPVFNSLIERNINDGTSPEYTMSFFAPAEALIREANSLLAEAEVAEASSLYLRACALLRIARFPYITSQPRINCAVKWQAWQRQKEIYLHASSHWDSPVQEIMVPHISGKVDEGESIPVYVRLPAEPDGLSRPMEFSDTDDEVLVEEVEDAHKLQTHQDKARARATKGRRSGHPVVIIMTGLDGYRPDNTLRCDEFLVRGWASIVVEIPGTADCPADPADPESPDRLWDSLFEWMWRHGQFDMHKVMVWGLSSGGYYAIRIAHTHRADLAGVVAQGAGCHYFYDPEWLDKADGHEYPFQLTPAMAMKHGYSSVEEYKKGAQKKFSLLETGIIQEPSTKLLLVNGVQDGLMPIEDSIMLCEYGTPKECRFFTGALHMGYPLANNSVYPWMEEVMSCDCHSRD